MREHIIDALRAVPRMLAAASARRLQPRGARTTFVALRDDAVLRGLVGRA